MVYTLDCENKLMKDGQEVGKPKSLDDSKGPMYGRKLPIVTGGEMKSAYGAGVLYGLSKKTKVLSPKEEKEMRESFKKSYESIKKDLEVFLK
jgi:hypothetical protein